MNAVPPTDSGRAPRLRAATPDDSQTIAALHVACWAETYRGLLPDALIDSMTVPDRSVQWQRALERRADVQVIVAEAPDGALLGFASGGPTRGTQLGSLHEVYAIYLRASAQRQGLGRALLQSLAAHLMLKSMESASLSLGLWVLGTNAPARGFYERMGGALAGERIERRDGVDLAEAAYHWTDLAALLRPSAQAPSPLDGSPRGFA